MRLFNNPILTRWMIGIGVSAWLSIVPAHAESAAAGTELHRGIAIAHAMANAVQAVDLMYAAGGATSIYARSRLDRCLRDVHTAAAHVWVAPDTYELAGRLLLGLDPGSTTI